MSGVVLPEGWSEERGEWTDGCRRYWRGPGFGVGEYPEGFRPIHDGRWICRDAKPSLADALDTCAEYARSTIESYSPMAAWNTRAPAEVSEAMVDAALDEFYGEGFQSSKESSKPYMRAALVAALGVRG